jgi:Sulfotransferase family
VTTLPRPAEGTGALQAPAGGTVAGHPRPLSSRAHILVVNGRKVRQPVFVIGVPQAGTEMLARAFKRTAGFHMTLGQRWVLPVVQAFARTPSLARGRPEAAATVLRDAFAQGWQVGPGCCLGCAQACRDAAGTTGTGPCVAEQGISRYGDASPELLYCADSLIDAFPDARLVQIVRDGRDVVAGMLADPAALAWFRPGFVNLETELTHPLLGLDSPPDRSQWAEASVAGKCAMRWRGTVRLMARLRMRLAPEQLITLRYEEVVRQPAAAASALSAFTGAEVARVEAHVAGTAMEPGAWRGLLTAAQVAEVERMAGEELRRVGYGA